MDSLQQHSNNKHNLLSIFMCTDILNKYNEDILKEKQAFNITKII